MEQYSGFDEIPHGDASDILTPGCLVLEGGAWRGLYTHGVLDALMENDINFETTIGVSAGAMSAMGYVAGQIGRCARINLRHRHDSRQREGNHAVERDEIRRGYEFTRQRRYI